MIDQRGAICALVALGQCMLAGNALAQNYPARPVKVIVPFAAGGGTDIVARAVMTRMGDEMGASFVIENRGGGNSNIGNEAVARAAPDGYTLLMTSSALAINPSLYHNLNYNAVKDFAPIGLATYVPLMLVVHPSLGVDNVKQFIELARSGKQISFGSAGTGNSTHLAMEALKYVAKLDALRHVPYRGTAQAVQDLLGNHVQALWGTIPSVLPHVRGGVLKGLAVGTMKRIATAPEMPTIVELGYQDFEVSTWFGLLAPAGTPKAIVDLLNAHMNKALATSQLTEVLSSQGAEPAANSPEEFQRYIENDVAKWRKVIDAAGIKPQ